MIVVWIGNNVAVAALMGRLGPATLAAHEIVRQLSLLFTLSVAFQAAIAIRVAQAAGVPSGQVPHVFLAQVNKLPGRAPRQSGFDSMHRSHP